MPLGLRRIHDSPWICYTLCHSALPSAQAAQHASQDGQMHEDCRNNTSAIEQCILVRDCYTVSYIHFLEKPAVVGLAIEVQGGWMSLNNRVTSQQLTRHATALT